MKLYQIITTESIVLNVRSFSIKSLREYLVDENIHPVIITVIS
ncbi:Uncharacterised protein [Moraxella ovis]|uniref:Uncharacterized protein n=1 Tax=Moraxella ovis TaxID=29433 RepID=A0A378PJZ1_9GAMM|nr:Uncharacterised protein [Moraxella ovis]